MGDRALPEVNRIVEARFREYKAEVHRKAVREVKAQVDRSSPPTFNHLMVNRKKMQTKLGLYCSPTIQSSSSSSLSSSYVIHI
jgi:hypothetical protein